MSVLGKGHQRDEAIFSTFADEPGSSTHGIVPCDAPFIFLIVAELSRHSLLFQPRPLPPSEEREFIESKIHRFHNFLISSSLPVGQAGLFLISNFPAILTFEPCSQSPTAASKCPPHLYGN
jgi:hypothetical protein